MANTHMHLKIAGALQIVQSIPCLVFSSYYVAGIINARRSGSEHWDENLEVRQNSSIIASDH